MSDYQAAVKKAEEAVAAMKDQKLKEVAFGKILEHLLSAEKQPASGNKQPERKITEKHGAVISKKTSGTSSWLRDLAGDGFFKNPQNAKAILDELAGRSHHLRASDLTDPLQRLCHEKVLRRKKLSLSEGKSPVWHWANW